MTKEIISVDAFCLKLTPYREVDVIAAFYTADFGLLRAVCKGVKKPNSKLAGACQLLTLNQLELRPGKGLYTLQSYARSLSYDDLRGDLQRLGQASIWAEIVYGLGEDADAHTIFTLLLESLSALSPAASSGRDWIAVTIYFHRRLLELAGYGNDWTHCVVCSDELPIETARFLSFSAKLGAFLCPKCAKNSENLAQFGVNSAQNCVKMSPQTLKLYLNPFESEHDSYFPRLQAFLQFYWSFRLEKSLKSFDVVASLNPVSA